MSSGDEQKGTGHQGERSESQPSGSRLGIIEELADFCLAAGEYGTAAEYYEQLIELARRVRGSALPLAEAYQKMADCLRTGGDFDRALSCLQEAERLLREDDDPIPLAGVLAEKAWIYVRQGNYELAEREGLRVLELVGDPLREREMACALNCLGTVALRRGQWDKAREIYESALSINRRLGDEERVAHCYNNLALVAKNQGDWERALDYQQSAVSISRRVGDSLSLAGQLNNLGIIYFKHGDWTDANHCWEEARDILESHAEKWEIACVRTNLGNYHRRLRRWDEAEDQYRQALEVSERNGDIRGRALAIESLAELARDRGDFPRARELFQEGLAVARGIAPRGDLVIEMLRGFAEAAVMERDWKLASSLAHQGLSLAVAAGDVFEEGRLLRALAWTSAALGHAEEAREHLDRSNHCLEKMGERYELASTLAAEGKMYAASLPLDLDRSWMAVRRAVDLFRALGATYELGEVLLTEAHLAVERNDGSRARDALEEGVALLTAAGSPATEERIRDIQGRIDRCLACASVSEANDLAYFARLSGELNRVPQVEDRLARLLELAATRVGAQRGRLVMGGENGNPPLLDVGWEDSPGMLPVPSEFAHGVLSLASGEETPLVSTDARSDDRLLDLDPPKEVYGILAVPVYAEGRAVGGLYLDKCRRSTFVPGAIDLAVALAGLASASFGELQARGERLSRERELSRRTRFPFIVTQNPRMLDILDTVHKLQETKVTVLLTGETGTGKELVAQAIHGSDEKGMVTVNCAAMAEGVLESELFGHVRGAFTDAYRDKEGLFSRAAGGTVFLDEIDKTSRNFQESLLLVVDKNEYRPVGANEYRRADFRIICATNRDLAREVEEGRFLKDLYYRLKVVCLRLPPLRERREDIPLLAEHFLSKYGRKFGRTGLHISSEALDLLGSYSWPGNVRDIEHEIERAVAFSANGEEISPDSFSEELRSWGSLLHLSEAGPLAQAVEQVERQMIREALRRADGNRSQAARFLGLSRRGLLNKIDRYGLRDSQV